LVRGIVVVNLVHSEGQEHYPVDYRIYDNAADGKTKNDHFKDMLVNAIANKDIQAKTVLFDSGYASWENLKRTFYTTVVVKLKKVPFKVKLFKLVALNGDIDWLITNELDGNLTAPVA